MSEDTMPDVSLIRDADLRKELERHKRRNLLPKLLALEVPFWLFRGE